jgi:hypothetical protein
VLAPIAGPLWLAEELVSMAQSLSDAEESDHPDRPAVMTSLTHGQILVLLEPLDALIGEIAGMLADPRRRPAVRLPMLMRPYSSTGAGLTTEYVPLPYVRGLLGGTSSIVGATQLLVVDDTKFFGHPQVPSWVTRAFTTAQGDLAALQTRLEAVQNRSAPVLSRRPADEAALRELALNLWDLANTALELGQRLVSPTLLEGAQPLPPPRQAAPQPVTGGGAPTAPPTVPQQSPAAPLPTPASPAPEPPGVRRDPATVQPANPPPAPPLRPPVPPEERVAPMPQIDIAPPQQSSGPRRPATPADQPRPLPQIGGATGEPAPRPAAAPASTTPVPPPGPGAAKAPRRPVDRKDRWLLSSRPARYRLRAAGQEDQAEARLTTFWDARDWSLSAAESSYLDEVQALTNAGAVTLSGRSQAEVPFAPIYRVVRGGTQFLGHTLQTGSLFSYDYHTGGHGLLTDLSPQAGVPDTP